MAEESGETSIGDALRWASETKQNPAIAAADWLTRDISSAHESAFALLSDPDAPVSTIIAAKDAFKTMRVLGETTADRQLAARLYATTIAVALVRHQRRITRQSSGAIVRALALVEQDAEFPDTLREIAALARNRLQSEVRSASDDGSDG